MIISWQPDQPARTLRNALGLETGEAHHIVAGAHRRAKRARAILRHYRIEKNKKLNGVGLTHDNHHGKRLHSYDGINKVQKQLESAIRGAHKKAPKGATGKVLFDLEKEAVEDALRAMAAQMKIGKFKI